MELGDRGPLVQDVQRQLIQWGYLRTMEGFYSVQTKRAVIELQRDLGLDETGVWDDDYVTLRKINGNKTYRGPIIYTAFADETTVTEDPAATSDESEADANECRKGSATFTIDPILCYILNLNTGKKVDFGVSVPDEIQDSYSANFEDQSVKGRSSPFKAYESSGPRSLSFTVELIADYCSQGIVQTVDFIRALCYPHEQTVIVEPRCRLVIGKFLKVNCVPQTVDVTWKKPYKDGIFSLADVSISLSEVEDEGKFASEVEPW